MSNPGPSSNGSQQAGVVLGPDGKPCKPCTAFRNWKPVGAGKDRGAAAAAQGECPADVEQLGRATWTFLHTTAAYYPMKPTASQQESMLGLLHSLPTLYPCSHCAVEFGERIKEYPAEGAVKGREELIRWLCERHNEVNDRLGKGTFNCEIVKLDERWKDGC